MTAFYTKDELIEMYGKTRATMLSDSLILKDLESFYKYIGNKELITTKKGDIVVPTLLIKELISNPILYKHLLDNLDSMDGYPIKLKYIENNRIVESAKYRRADIVYALRKMNISTLPIHAQINSTSIISLSTTRSCEIKYNNYIHKSIIDGVVYSMEAKDLLSILTESESEFEVFRETSFTAKYDKKYILYLLRDFVERERIFEKYTFDERVYERYNNIINYKYFDFESLNKNNKTDDYDGNGESIVEKIKLDEDFVNEIKKYSKKTYGPLENAIHIYYRMCELLSYDESAYINKKSIDIDRRIDLDHLASINKENNKVVCYEFAFIYACILKKLGINYTMNAKSFMDTDGYAYLDFRYQEFLIKADAIDNILDSDLTNAKIGERMHGLICINENPTTQKKFNEIANKVRLNILKRKKELDTFDRSINTYREEIDKQFLSTKDKIKLLFKILTKDNLKGMDKLIYQRKIFESILGNDNRISINFLCNDMNPFTIISYLENGLYKYYVINENYKDKLRIISKDELMTKLDNGIYRYINDEDIIPGLNIEKGVSYAK